MNSLLTRPKTIQDLYRNYFSFANKFQFTSLLRNYIQNEEWKDKSQDAIWSVISNISDDISAVLTDDIVNYTRNVVDVNTCKIPQMIEHSQMLSYRLEHVKNSYQFFPLKIQCLVDIFSINSEYLIGNGQNHILSDQVIKEILIYIRDNCKDRDSFLTGDLVDRLIDDPHGLTDDKTYRAFVNQLFFVSIYDALTTKYSDQDTEPMVFNLLWKEKQDQNKVLSLISNYRSWIDKFIWNEIEHPLNDSGMENTLYDSIQSIKYSKNMSPKFDPFKIADDIYFYGLNPTNNLSSDELDLVERVLDYHSRTKYDYKNQRFSDDVLKLEDGTSVQNNTQYAYYKELEFCEYVKMVMFIMNNIQSFDMNVLSYDVSSNKFIQTSSVHDQVRSINIFRNGDCLISNKDGSVAIDIELLGKVSKFLCNYVFYLQGIRENIKTISQKHAMRGTGALLVHMVNDYMLKELPTIRDNLEEHIKDTTHEKFKFRWEEDPSFYNYGNAKVLEYEDDNEYFNIEPTKDVRFTERTNERYWEKVQGMQGYDDSLGVLTKGQIRDFYRETLGIGRLQPKTPSDYDDIADFLIDLFKIGANPISYESGELKNPIDDILNRSEEDYGYTKNERLDVQKNTKLRSNQERQFLEYSGNEDIVSQGIYDFVNNRTFYWKNMDFSSHVLHPFMYNLKIWNKLNNIIINGYKNYANSDLVDYLSSKKKFDELFWKYGESKNFWKYNVMDLTGYTTRYESAIKNENKDDLNRTQSELTGYDGLFYPSAAQAYLDIYNDAKKYKFTYSIRPGFFTDELDIKDGDDQDTQRGKAQVLANPFLRAIYSIYWQKDKLPCGYDKNESKVIYDEDTFYIKWYSHLNYTRSEYQKIAIQLWYWRERIVELIRTNYPISKYCLDIQGNSLILVQTFTKEDEDNNPYLIDLMMAQDEQVGEPIQNTHSTVCDNHLVKPSELWIRWKSNPIALPAFDIEYDVKTSDDEFNKYYRSDSGIQLGQLTYANNDCNENFYLVAKDWISEYKEIVPGNRLPVFFDMEQSANVLACASWKLTPRLLRNGIVQRDSSGNPVYKISTAKNPFHIVSIERTTMNPSEYNLEEYGSNTTINSHDGIGNYVFDSYHYCPANGSLLIPLYLFDCREELEDGETSHQKLSILMFVIPAQELKNANYVVNDRIQCLTVSNIDLNEQVPYGKDLKKFRFDNPIKVCKNTNLVFSPYDDNGLNKVKCAFLGNFPNALEKQQFKVSCGMAKTRYGFDSKTIVDIAQLKQNYFKDDDGSWTDGMGNKMSNSEYRKYIDKRISDTGFNSYDSLDKYVLVLDFDSPIDNKTLFDVSSMSGLSAYSYNILSDSGMIPHFAYQSLVKYGDKDGGTNYTWMNKYLKGKSHMQFELLGIDDSTVAQTYEQIQRLVVKDTTDNCDTLINPMKLIDDIYRIWCDVRGGKDKTQEDKGKQHFFIDEYKDYPNDEIDFNEKDEVIWSPNDRDLFEVDPENLEDYYVSVLRTENANILNEKRYLLKPFKVSSMLLDNSEYVKCNIGKWHSSNIKDNHFVSSQVIFTGTQNPFNYDNDGERIFSIPEELQYGNSIKGIGELFIKVEEIERTVEKWVIDGHTKTGKNKWKKEFVKKTLLKPTLKIRKFQFDKGYEEPSLEDKVQLEVKKIESGAITIILSRKNPDDIAKYHILNRYSNLYYNGSLPKSYMLGNYGPDDTELDLDPYWMNNPEDWELGNNNPPEYISYNGFKFSDFKFNQTVHLVEYSKKVDGESTQAWKSKETDEDGNPILDFTIDDVVGSIEGDRTDVPPYFIKDQYGYPKWFLEQDKLVENHEDYQKLYNDVWKKDDDPNIVCEETSEDELMCKCYDSTQSDIVCYDDRTNKKDKLEVGRYKPVKGNFKLAHEVKSKPEKYLDYLYVQNKGLAFKVNEESQSFAEAMDMIPPFYIDEKLKNKLQDLNDIQILQDYSTFIHQSENPEDVKNSSSFNPLYVNAILKHGLKQTDSANKDELPVVICITDTKNPDNQVPIELSNSSAKTKLRLQLENHEIDDYLKIYTNYVKVSDENGDFHYDLYFNIQNLFNSPFEYISTVTNQPNVLILKDSYLYLSGDKYTNGKIDNEKVDLIKKGGVLTIYGQVKTYSNDKLSDVRTIKLFSYNVYNISDDKPKFLIDKTFDITKSSFGYESENKVDIEFGNVMWTLNENQFEGYEPEMCFKDDVKVPIICEKGDEDDKVLCSNPTSPDNKFKVLNEDVIVIQPMKIRYNWNYDDNSRMKSISFDVMNDVIDFDSTPILCDYHVQNKTLRRRPSDPREKDFEPYYDHWSDDFMTMKYNENTSSYRFTFTWDDKRDQEHPGYNFETVYLRWKLPKGFKVMDTIDRLQGYVFSSTAQNVEFECNDDRTVMNFNIKKGYVTARVSDRVKYERKEDERHYETEQGRTKVVKPGKMYLGLEHSTTKRMNGYVLVGLADAMRTAISSNDTLDKALTEETMKDLRKSKKGGK